MKRAIFPGSFDPITLGHVDVIHRAIDLFDEIIIAIGVNNDKKYLFSLEQRMQFIKETFAGNTTVKVTTYQGLTIDYCKKIDADYILRGLRNPADFEFEKAIAQTNRKLSGIETIFLLTSPDTAFISSSIVRDVYRNKGDISSLVPSTVTNSSK